MKKFWNDNSLTIVFLGLFFTTFLLGQTVTGHREYNSEQRDHNEATVTWTEYLGTGHFREATFENWESEFLQMASYVLLTAFLVQRGSAESKKPADEGENPQDVDPRNVKLKPDTPWPVRAQGAWLKIYENSLAIFFAVLFFVSAVVHAHGGVSAYNSEQEQHNQPANYNTWSYLTTARFWFESFQNWQSEFMAVGAIVLGSIWLRQKGSPESKAVHEPHSKTGAE